MPERRCFLSRALLIGVICLVTSACSLTKSKVVDEVLIDSPRGTVFLQNAGDGWFKTAHPLTLSPTFLASIFQGVHVQTAPPERAEGDPVFSNEETEFLSAVMSTALSKAVKSQVVGFRVHHETDAGGGTTGGILYVQGRLLHLTFTQYHADGRQPAVLDTRRLKFVPESARRSSRHEQPDVTKIPPLASLVIDYETLPSWSAPSAGTPATIHGRPGAPVGEIGPAQGMAKDKEAELEVLKEEVRALQRRLLELEGTTQRKKEP